ncbi:MAG TPA: DUF1990 domain-containing protein [Vicinamibacterales bacterium]|nr:DUF1990 domain-containing protein [Vicinamibacterales bacterium]
MFLARRPSPATIDRVLRDAATLPLSYAPIGIVDEAGDRYRMDELAATVGHGADDFDRAVAALRAWKQFDVGWVELHPRDASTEISTNVAVLISHLGFWSLNGCRVVSRVDAADGRRFGYAYGTLPTHAEAGEERFEVSWDRESGDVLYRIRAISWPAVWLARAGQPIVRALQDRFRRDSLAAVRRAVRAR